MLDAWALGFALAAGCLQPLGDAIATLAEPTDPLAEPTAGTETFSAADASSLFVGHAGFTLAPAPRWIRHRLRPRERLTAIAARYGVSLDDLLRWNRLDGNGVPPRKRHLRVFTDRNAPPLRQIRYAVGTGETWDDIAANLRIPEHDLRVQNYRHATPAAGDILVAWIDPLEGTSFAANTEPTSPPPLPPIGEGRSVGLPQRGKIVDAVQLPEHPLWVRGNPDHLWGSAHAVRVIHHAFAILRGELGYPSGILIGAMSRRRGGHAPPHRSHQSGRDIDIRLPLRVGLGKTRSPNADEIDWYATWALIDAFARTEEVEAVYLNEVHHGRLYEAARAMGIERARVHAVVRWPSWRGGSHPMVQHADGHNAHLHVRVRCGDEEARCKMAPRFE